MADLERIAPPVPTLPTPIGRNVDRSAGARPRASRAEGRIPRRRRFRPKPNPTT